MSPVTKRFQALGLMILSGVVVSLAPLVMAEEINLTPGDLNDDLQGNGVTTLIRYDNENWFTLPHPKPATVVISSTGEMYGTTTNGIPFTQVNVANSFGIRIQEFSIQDHHHYIVEGEEIYTAEDLSKRIGQFYEVQ
jgi:hypothetical protein